MSPQDKEDLREFICDQLFLICYFAILSLIISAIYILFLK